MRILYRILCYIIIPFISGLVLLKVLNGFPVVATCVVKNYTGLDCPGCGGQRAIDSIIKGEFKEAFYYNQLIYFYISIIGYIYVLVIETYVLKNREIMQRFGFSNRFAFIFILLIAGFFIIRNS